MASPPTGVVYADTSFLFSLVLHDANTAAAIAHLRVNPTPLAFSELQACELRNALRLSAFRGRCDAAAAGAALAKVEANVAAGNFQPVPLVWPDVLGQADAVSVRHTVALGVRTLDLLHVAAALTIGATVFLTFDDRQRTVARAVGLRAERP